MRVVAIGGGTGLSTLLRGLKPHVIAPPAIAAERLPAITRLTAIVTVTDEGGSSGRLRRDFGMLPPGDIRNCLVALAEDEQLLTRLFSYRFTGGRGLAGHSLGNLFLAALTRLTRDFSKAVQVSSEVLAVRGEIFPSTLSDVRLKARLAGGRTVYGESRITRTPEPIERLELVPRGARALPDALIAIDEADLITLGPGSLYTSLIPNLLVQGIANRISRAHAVKILVTNLMTQPGETRDYTASDHLRAIREHSRGRLVFDYVVLNGRPISARLRRQYAAEGAVPVLNDLENIKRLGAQPITADLLGENHVARHDTFKLARLLLRLAQRGRHRPRRYSRKAARAMAN